jgi:hypothetical protein
MQRSELGFECLRTRSTTGDGPAACPSAWSPTVFTITHGLTNSALDLCNRRPASGSQPPLCKQGFGGAFMRRPTTRLGEGQVPVSVAVSFIFVRGSPPTVTYGPDVGRWTGVDPGGQPSLQLKSGRSAVRCCP